MSTFQRPWLAPKRLIAQQKTANQFALVRGLFFSQAIANAIAATLRLCQSIFDFAELRVCVLTDRGDRTNANDDD
jgi:hypothetical protein